MANHDVESFFTNVTLNEVVDTCIGDLFCDSSTIHNLDQNNMREILTLAAHE